MKQQKDSALATKKDIVLAILNLEEKLEKRFVGIDKNAKKYRDDILNGLDEVMGELEKAREDRILAVHQTRQITEQVNDHEERIAKLETPQI